MFYSLTGKIIHKDEQSVAILCGSVGFKCFTTRSTLAKINASGNSEATLFTYLNVREDALDLFGFYTNEELDKLVELRPKSIEELKSLNILSPVKIKTHGELIINSYEGQCHCR